MLGVCSAEWWRCLALWRAMERWGVQERVITLPLSLGRVEGECSSLEDCLRLFTQPEALTGDSSLPALDPTAPVMYAASHCATAVCNVVRIADEAASGNEARCRLGCLGAPHAAAYTRLRDDCAHL